MNSQIQAPVTLLPLPIPQQTECFDTMPETEIPDLNENRTSVVQTIPQNDNFDILLYNEIA